jgi:hypothetical protein
MHVAFGHSGRPVRVEDGNPFFISCGAVAEMTDLRGVTPKTHLVTHSQQLVTDGGLMDNSLVITNKSKVGGQALVQVEDLPVDGFDFVIVDEAHHYPAETWKRLIDRYPTSVRLFLTATAVYKGKYILGAAIDRAVPIPPCYQLSREDAVAGGFIRDIRFNEVGSMGDDDAATMQVRSHFVHFSYGHMYACSPPCAHHTLTAMCHHTLTAMCHHTLNAMYRSHTHCHVPMCIAQHLLRRELWTLFDSSSIKTIRCILKCGTAV